MKTASGNDIISRMFYALGLDERIVYLPFISSIKLKDLPRLSMGKIDEDMLKALLELLNNVNYDIKKDECEIQEEWWKEAVFYEIYPRSFKDSNNDGIGDIEGIIQKLDYLKDLGVDALWVCPFYDSPDADNGYDVRDYYKVQKEFGEPADVKRLFKEVHKRGMRIIVDLVLNHTSDEHEWFKKSLKGIKPYDDFYIWRDKPNNWESMFKTDTWKYFKERKQYALHLFCDKQMFHPIPPISYKCSLLPMPVLLSNKAAAESSATALLYVTLCKFCNLFLFCLFSAVTTAYYFA